MRPEKAFKTNVSCQSSRDCATCATGTVGEEQRTRVSHWAGGPVQAEAGCGVWNRPVPASGKSGTAGHFHKALLAVIQPGCLHKGSDVQGTATSFFFLGGIAEKKVWVFLGTSSIRLTLLVPEGRQTALYSCLALLAHTCNNINSNKVYTFWFMVS